MNRTFVQFCIKSIVETNFYILQILTKNKNIKYYNACSSECFGDTGNESANEKTKFKPSSPYAIAKSTAYWTLNMYREVHNIYACSGILFNHESSFRGEEFVTRKVVKNACLIKHGKIKNFNLGNIFSVRDWGFAGDYVEAMWKMMQKKLPNDYVIATNKTHSVKKLVEEVFNQLNIPYVWKKNNKSIELHSKGKCLIKTNSKNELRPTDVIYLRGNFNKAKNLLNWRPKTNFKNLIKKMIEEELKRI